MSSDENPRSADELKAAVTRMLELLATLKSEKATIAQLISGRNEFLAIAKDIGEAIVDSGEHSQALRKILTDPTALGVLCDTDGVVARWLQEPLVASLRPEDLAEHDRLLGEVARTIEEHAMVRAFAAKARFALFVADTAGANDDHVPKTLWAAGDIAQFVKLARFRTFFADRNNVFPGAGDAHAGVSEVAATVFQDWAKLQLAAVMRAAGTEMGEALYFPSPNHGYYEWQLHGVIKPPAAFTSIEPWLRGVLADNDVIDIARSTERFAEEGSPVFEFIGLTTVALHTYDHKDARFANLLDGGDGNTALRFHQFCKFLLDHQTAPVDSSAHAVAVEYVSRSLPSLVTQLGDLIQPKPQMASVMAEGLSLLGKVEDADVLFLDSAEARNIIGETSLLVFSAQVFPKLAPALMGQTTPMRRRLARVYTLSEFVRSVAGQAEHTVQMGSVRAKFPDQLGLLKERWASSRLSELVSELAPQTTLIAADPISVGLAGLVRTSLKTYADSVATSDPGRSASIDQLGAFVAQFPAAELPDIGSNAIEQ